MMLTLKAFITVALVALFSTGGAKAGVSLKNGNFFIGYLDLIYPGGFEPKIERVYNSKASHNGWFGFGWGSDYETHLIEMSDGTVIVQESGGGSRSHFRPANYSADSVSKTVASVVAAVKKQKPMGADEMKSLNALLIKDAFKRQEYAEKYGIKFTHPTGTTLTSLDRGVQVLKKTETGWSRTLVDGKIETFGSNGKLSKIVDRNQNWLVLTYDKSNMLKNIRDNFNRQIDFEFNTTGKVTAVSGPGKKATYQYQGEELVSSKDTEGNVYRYAYSKDGRHNLSRITYSDNKFMEIVYYPSDKFEMVKSIKEKDGNTTEYAYGDMSDSKDNYFTSVASKTPDGNVVSKQRYDYLIKKRIDGQEFTKMMKTDIDGDITTTEYNENGLPEKITRGDKATSFRYSTNGLLVFKDTPYELVNLSYDTKWNKVNKVEKVLKADKAKKKNWSVYSYDERGNLKAAKSWDGRQVSILYDRNGRIHTMIDQSGRKIQFRYNEYGKPVEIIDPKMGKIQVEYSNTGEIKKVHSDAGKKVALQVTSAFQNLLEIIKPAGVTLTAN